MKFVASADWQLGMTANFLPYEARVRFHEARLDAVRRIGDVAAQHGAGFVVVAGDVFESNHLDRAVLGRSLDAMADIAVPVWLLPGNHDPLDAASIFSSEDFARRRPSNVHVLDTPGLHEVADGVDVIAAPWFSKRPLHDLVGEALAGVEADPTRRRIVVGHGATWSVDPDNPSAIDQDRLSDALGTGLADFAVLGDRHSTTEVATNVWYPGAPEVTARRELDPGNVLVVDLGDRTEVRRVPVGQWDFSTVTAELHASADVDELLERLDARANRRRTAVWLALTGTVTLRDKARLDAALEDRTERFASLALWERHTDLAVLPDDGELGDLGLSGWARDALAELTERAEESQTARDALSLVYRLSGDGA